MTSPKDFESVKNPTNKDIVLLLTTMQLQTEDHQREVGRRLKAVEEQVKYTNGKVRALTTWRGELEAVEKYKSQQLKDSSPSIQQVKVEANNNWDWKTVLAILLTIATCIAGVLGVVNVTH